jgi:hypothetical protein
VGKEVEQKMTREVGSGGYLKQKKTNLLMKFTNDCVFLFPGDIGFWSLHDLRWCIDVLV